MSDDTPLALVFGTGVFIRGYMGWFLQHAVDKQTWRGNAIGIKLTRGMPLGSGFIEGRSYPLIVRGIREGKQIDESSEVSVIKRWIDPHTANGYADLLATARHHVVDLIVSNATEAGLCYVPTPRPTNGYCPDSYPAKLTAWLAERFATVHERPVPPGQAPGREHITVLPLELVVDAGRRLADLVRQHADCWELGPAFTEWLDAHVSFRSALVDRIVTKPGHEDDPMLVVAEPYQLLCVEAEEESSEKMDGPSGAERQHSGEVHEIKRQRRACSGSTGSSNACHGGGGGGGGGEGGGGGGGGEGGGTFERKLGFRRAGLNVVYTRDLAAWRVRKVRVLNGAHHTLCFLGMRLQLTNVRDCMEHATLGPFVRHVLKKEVLPTLDGDETELEAYAEAVLERFTNPFLDHRLASIGLNSSAKVRERLIPTIADFMRRQVRLQPLDPDPSTAASSPEGGAPPPGLTLALAAFLAHEAPPLDGCEPADVRTEVAKSVPGLSPALEAAVKALQGCSSAATTEAHIAAVMHENVS